MWQTFTARSCETTLMRKHQVGVPNPKEKKHSVIMFSQNVLKVLQKVYYEIVESWFKLLLTDLRTLKLAYMRNSSNKNKIIYSPSWHSKPSSFSFFWTDLKLKLIGGYEDFGWLIAQMLLSSSHTQIILSNMDNFNKEFFFIFTEWKVPAWTFHKTSCFVLHGEKIAEFFL